MPRPASGRKEVAVQDRSGAFALSAPCYTHNRHFKESRENSNFPCTIQYSLWRPLTSIWLAGFVILRGAETG